MAGERRAVDGDNPASLSGDGELVFRVEVEAGERVWFFLSFTPTGADATLEPLGRPHARVPGRRAVLPEDFSPWDGMTPGVDRGAPRHASHQRGKDVDLSLVDPELLPLYADGRHLQHYPNHDDHVHVRVSEEPYGGSAIVVGEEPFEAP